MDHNLGDSVAEETVSEPKFPFQHWQDKISYNICKILKKLQMSKT